MGRVSSASGSTTIPAQSRRGRAFVLASLVLMALNLRAAVGSVGVVLAAIRSDLGMSVTVGGVLTTLPVLCFAFFGVTANDIVRHLGLHRTAVTSIAFTVVGLAVRTVVHDGALFITASAVALAGCAVGNVLLPPLVKLHFPDHIASVSSLYGAAIMAGAALSAALTVPVADAFGGWRIGLAVWAVLALVTVLPWLVLSRRDVQMETRARSAFRLSVVARSPLAWVMALFFGTQSAQAYAQFGWLPQIFTDAGLSDSYAGLMQGILSGVAIPLTLALPYLLRRVGDRTVLPWTFGLLTIAGWLGVLLWPTTVPWLWAVLLGLGGAAFTWVLTMLGKRTTSPDGTAALSSFVQGLGYLLAAVGPFGAGVLHDLTGSWTTPLLCLIGLAVLMSVLGTYICRPQTFEETIG